ncbi:ABC-type transport system involved in multi-copper enzyme maturation permease subunit [Saccharothrix ecbatanensis]|uniref:ABC-type transport system involved in multi-copper enzyme maturation permease subunit n=1 Tax=Saccharothrix ecbatanensis TaxID=1105145 RepID=A0A7W9LYY9_9PSEU|nr:ABC transporter permease subunit [Saccharothrix ecbatanensis]MBB5801355.1 ABC-type transport system involved in multi-copper enzyme maturation permease subunit [Saccharothrix ecbatanensis]
MTGVLWVAWRGQRAQFAAIGALVLLYGVVALTERLQPDMAGLTGQLAGLLAGAVCLVLGAPLVARELETGTCKLAWTQSVTRGRWLAANLAVAAAGAVAAAAALAALLAWVAHDPVGEPMAWPYYESHGVLPFARVVFALALGAALGALTGHTRIAMPLSVLLLGACQLVGRAVRGRFDLPYWHLQWTETAVYFTAAAALTTVAHLTIRHRA